MKRNKSTALNNIRDHYLNGTELSKKNEDIRLRWTAVFTLLCNYHSNQQAIPKLMSQFQISEAQAYRDLNNSMQLFGDVLKASKDGHRYIIYELAMKTYQVAAKNGDYKAMSQSVGNMIKLLGLDRLDPDLPDFQKMQPSLNVIMVPDNMKSILERKLETGPVVRKMEDYTDYEDLK